MNLVTPKAGAKNELLFNEPASRLVHINSTRLFMLSNVYDITLLSQHVNVALKMNYCCPLNTLKQNKLSQST